MLRTTTMFVRVFGLKVKLAWNVLAKTLNRFSLTSLSSDKTGSGDRLVHDISDQSASPYSFTLGVDMKSTFLLLVSGPG